MATKVNPTARTRFEESIQINTKAGRIEGSLAIPDGALGAVIFAHGSGSSRHSPRNRFVAQALHDVELATLLIDLLTVEEEQTDMMTAEHRFDIDLLTERLGLATDWLEMNFEKHGFAIGYFGASTGAAAALIAAARRPRVAAVVSRGGRPDLASPALGQVYAATLLIVGGYDLPVIDMNRAAFAELTRARHKELKIIPKASHLFEEVGALAEVARLAGQWFVHYLCDERKRTSQ